MKPIETEYKNTLFRSRLEARWAVFFDCMEIPWEYEPNVINAAKAGKYIPDFWLPTCEYFAEVKPVDPRKWETDKMRATGGCLLMVGPPALKYYWRLTAKPDEIAFVFHWRGILDLEPEEAPTQPSEFDPRCAGAIERALQARFDGYDWDRWLRRERYE